MEAGAGASAAPSSVRLVRTSSRPFLHLTKVPLLCAALSPLRPLPTVAARLWTLEHVRHGQRGASVPILSVEIVAALLGRDVVNENPLDPAQLSGSPCCSKAGPSLARLALSGITASGKISRPSGDVDKSTKINRKTSQEVKQPWQVIQAV